MEQLNLAYTELKMLSWEKYILHPEDGEWILIRAGYSWENPEVIFRCFTKHKMTKKIYEILDELKCIPSL